jgi:mannose-6-phosphate isomerase-like protein (cupin superfamily)
MSIAEQQRPEVTEEEHREAESRIVKFSYKKPTGFDRPKVTVRLGQTDVLRGHIQVIREGGENNLHYHSKVDGMFTVLKGRARFYGPGDELLGEFGPLEGIVIPRNARYWFESVGEEEAEIMLVQGFHEHGAEKSGRTDSAPRRLQDAGEGGTRYSAVVK